MFLTSKVTRTVGSSRKVACVQLANKKTQSPTVINSPMDVFILLRKRAATLTPRVRMKSGLGLKCFSRVECTKYDLCLIRNFTSAATISPLRPRLEKLFDAPLETVDNRRRESGTICLETKSPRNF